MAQPEYHSRGVMFRGLGGAVETAGRVSKAPGRAESVSSSPLRNLERLRATPRVGADVFTHL